MITYFFSMTQQAPAQIWHLHDTSFLDGRIWTGAPTGWTVIVRQMQIGTASLTTYFSRRRRAEYSDLVSR